MVKAISYFEIGSANKFSNFLMADFRRFEAGACGGARAQLAVHIKLFRNARIDSLFQNASCSCSFAWIPPCSDADVGIRIPISAEIPTG